LNLQEKFSNFCSNQRSDFKSEPYKMVSLVGCQIILSDNNLQLDMFQIVDQQRGMLFKMVCRIMI